MRPLRALVVVAAGLPAVAAALDPQPPLPHGRGSVTEQLAPPAAVADDAARAKARLLIEEAVELAGAAPMELHVLALLHAGEAYREFDAAKSAAWLRQAFAATAALGDDGRTGAQARVVKAAAKADRELGAEMLRGMADPGSDADNGQSAADSVVEIFVEKKEFDRALEVLNLLPETALYPFAAAQRLFEKLPEGDGRRVILFGKAQAAYARQPGAAFHEFLARHWRDVPRPMADTALSAVVQALRSVEEDKEKSETLKTEKGSVKLASRQSIELFRLAAVLRALAPKKLEEVAAAYPDLREALAAFPDGRTSAAWSQVSSSTTSRTGWGVNETDSDDETPLLSLMISMTAPGRDIREVLETRRKMAPLEKQILKVAASNPRKALGLARELPHAGARAEAAARIAEAAAAKDPQAAREVLNAAAGLIADAGAPEDRVMAWIALAAAAHAVKDDKAAWEAFEKALADSVELLRYDTGAEPNRAPREYWPSRQTCRMALHGAAKAFGPRAATLLAGMESRDLALLGRIDLAEALLGRDLTSWQVLFTR